jgi:hypothetical protein
MPSANTLPDLASRHAAAIRSGVMEFSVPISSSGSHFPSSPRHAIF